ncbi:MAG: ferritin-like domain-containing protein [Myxococcaceae bacterium]
MRVSREEMRFDFGGAKFRLPRDAPVLGWIFNQFLYGEVTGIQCGHWLYRAPTLEAARFFARQASEELSHVQQFVSLLSLVGARPEQPNRWVRFLATGAMGTDFAEHVATEMAVGEGLVLQVLYALTDTIEDERIVKTLEGIARQEERHVAFGEEQTAALVQRNPALAKRLLGLNLVSFWGIERIGRHVARHLDPTHEVLRLAPMFLAKMKETLSLRLERLGLTPKPIVELTATQRSWLVSTAVLSRPAARLFGRRRLLTDTYLADPSLLG